MLLGVGGNREATLAGAYLFIDGAYLENRYKAVMEQVFLDPGDLDYKRLNSQLGAFRNFYYDATETKLTTDTDATFAARLDAQQAKFDAINDIPGFHVRAGVTAGDKKKRRRQKEVDVQLAVDMLMHGIRGNISHVRLIAGDRDFRPLVEAAVSLGMRVEVLYEKETGSKELYRAADVGTRLDVTTLHAWSSEKWAAAHVMVGLSGESVGNRFPMSLVGVGEGTVGQRPMSTHRDCNSKQYYMYLLSYERTHHRLLTHLDFHLLCRFAEYEYGPISWDRAPDLTP